MPSVPTAARLDEILASVHWGAYAGSSTHSFALVGWSVAFNVPERVATYWIDRWALVNWERSREMTPRQVVQLTLGMEAAQAPFSVRRKGFRELGASERAGVSAVVRPLWPEPGEPLWMMFALGRVDVGAFMRAASDGALWVTPLTGCFHE